MSIQTTFTKQKRELAKAHELIQSIRAQEVRQIRYNAKGKMETVQRSAWLIDTPESLASQVFQIIREVVAQHGARQQANSVNKGRFEFEGIQADLTVPQCRALQDVLSTLTELVNKLPAENKSHVPNGEIDGRPAYIAPMENVTEDRVRYVPYEDKDSTRVRTYEEHYQEVVYKNQTAEIDYGFPVLVIKAMKELLSNLSTAIQVAIDEANAQPQKKDEELERVIGKITEVFEKQLQR
ncbi:MAG: hypothetical protein IJG38_09945 [Thermoguttaceae bacterium]|nr:hypothetical protein [Thermoguttaceae bacterium]